MIHDIIGSGILVAVGAAPVWAVMRVRLAIAHHRQRGAEADAAQQSDQFLRQLGHTQRAERAHSRLSDAHNSTKERIERALECETANAAHGVRKMAAILRGER